MTKLTISDIDVTDVRALETLSTMLSVAATQLKGGVETAPDPSDSVAALMPQIADHVHTTIATEVEPPKPVAPAPAAVVSPEVPTMPAPAAGATANTSLFAGGATTTGPAPAPTAAAMPSPPPTPPTAPAAPTAQLDSAGLSWDARINNSKKSLMKDRTFKLKPCPKEFTPEQWRDYVAQVQAELRGALPAPAPAAPAAGASPTPPTAPVVSAPVVPAVAPTAHTFGTLAAAIQQNAISDERVGAACMTASGSTVPSFALLGARQELIPAVAAQLGL